VAEGGREVNRVRVRLYIGAHLGRDVAYEPLDVLLLLTAEVAVALLRGLLDYLDQGEET